MAPPGLLCCSAGESVDLVFDSVRTACDKAWRRRPGGSCGKRFFTRAASAVFVHIGRHLRFFRHRATMRDTACGETVSARQLTLARLPPSHFSVGGPGTNHCPETTRTRTTHEQNLRRHGHPLNFSLFWTLESSADRGHSALPSTVTMADARSAGGLRTGCVERHASGPTTAWHTTPESCRTELPSLYRSVSLTVWSLGSSRVVRSPPTYLGAKPVLPIVMTRYDYDEVIAMRLTSSLWCVWT